MMDQIGKLRARLTQSSTSAGVGERRVRRSAFEALELLMQHLGILARQHGNVEHAKSLEQLAEPDANALDPRQIGTLNDGEEKLRRNLG